MNNKSVSDFVAASMNAVLESDDHKSLFGTMYKQAQGIITKHKDKDPSSECDGVLARGECLKCHKTFDMSKADDNSAKDGDSCGDSVSSVMMADDNNVESSGPKTSSAFDIAIDGLLTASATLDSVGFSKSSALSLKIASFVVEAAKKEKAKKEKGKKDGKSGKSSSSSSKSDSNAAKDKKGGKKDEKSSSSSSSKKPAKKDEKSSDKKSKK